MDLDFIPLNDKRIKSLEFADITINTKKFNIEEDKKECCICMEQKKNTEFCILNCKHLFCITCITKNLHKNINCPVCRTIIVNITVQNNYAKKLCKIHKT